MSANLREAVAREQELRADLERVTRERDEIVRAPTAVDDAFDEIAELVRNGASEWEYAGQVVRDVKALLARERALREALQAMRRTYPSSPGHICTAETGLCCHCMADRAMGAAITPASDSGEKR